jgi:hypothetical protein
MKDQDAFGWAVAAGAVLLLLVMMAHSYWKKRQRAELEGPGAAAFLIEDVRVTGAGQFCAVMLALHNLGILLFWSAGARSAVQEAVIGLIWIAGNQLWSLGVMLGRRRTFVMRRPPEAE